MSVKLITRAFGTTLPPTDKLILLCLADAANDQGSCFFLVGTLCSKCSVSESTVQRSLRKLEENGLLTRNYRKGRSTVFVLHPEAWPMQPEDTREEAWERGGVKLTGVSPVTPGGVAHDTHNRYLTKRLPVAREEMGSTEVNSSRYGQWTGQHQSARMASPEEAEVF